MSKAIELHAQYVAIIEEMELYLEPLVDKWISIQIKMGKLPQGVAMERFLPEETVNKDSLFFVRDENSGYTESYYGPATLRIPKDFFEDPTPYEEELERFLANKTKTETAAAKKDAKAEVRSLKVQLARAEAEVVKLSRTR